MGREIVFKNKGSESPMEALCAKKDRRDRLQAENKGLLNSVSALEKELKSTTTGNINIGSANTEVRQCNINQRLASVDNDIQAIELMSLMDIADNKNHKYNSELELVSSGFNINPDAWHSDYDMNVAKNGLELDCSQLEIQNSYLLDRQAQLKTSLSECANNNTSGNQLSS
jgi:hypothetical protein